MRIRSFRGRVFLALMIIGVVPSVLILGTGALAFRSAVDLSGTAGPWNAIAESGVELFERIDAVGLASPEIQAAVRRHGQELETSVQNSNLYAALARRLSRTLPLFALAFFLFVVIASLLAARGLSRELTAPIGELVDWTGRVARGTPLPPETDLSGTRATTEFERLRVALRGMAVDLEEGRRKAVESARLRSWTEVARRVAHEIKNPLTPIQISAAALARNEQKSVADAATIILEEVQRLDELARSFSQLGRMPEGPGAPVDVVELLQGLAARHSDADVKIEVDVNGEVPLIPGHHEALVRVFRNLIANAGEACESVSSPTTVVAQISALADEIEILILDRGPGFSGESISLLWDPEFTTKLGGTGIGLALVKNTIEAHGGDVSASNREGGGACVRVTLPIQTQGS